jgi:uncharacterized protein (DUF488 family)
MDKSLFTIGYGDRSLGEFIALLKKYNINALCDVRSMPFSRFNPSFNKDRLENELKISGIKYVFLGAELGGRPDDLEVYVDGKVNYELVAKTEKFKYGLKRINDALIFNYRPALMCAEKDPIICHRTMLITKQFKSNGVLIKHIIDKNKIETNAEFENRLVKFLNINPNLFDGNNFNIYSEMAYEVQGNKIAFKFDPKKDKNEGSEKIIKLFTMGFTKLSAERFFNTLKRAGVKKVIDVRLNNESQLSGFSKKEDLRFFLKNLGNIEYEHNVNFAPTKEMLNEYKKNKGSWEVYEENFNDLIKRRRIEQQIKLDDLNGSCLLCSEDTPEHCHRRLIVEYLVKNLGNTVEVTHL